MDSSSSHPVSSSSSRAPPLSLPEFVDLVSAALDSPALDPVLSFTSPQPRPAPVERRKSGMRQMFAKFKTLVTRYNTPSRPSVGRHSTSPEYRIPELHLPYTPLAVHSEHHHPYPSRVLNPKVYSISTPALPLYRVNSISSSSGNASLSSCSSASSDVQYPTTPLTTVSEEGGSRWSACSSTEAEHLPAAAAKPLPLRLPSFASIPNFHTHTSTPMIKESYNTTLRRSRTRRAAAQGPPVPPPAYPLPPPPPKDDEFMSCHPYARARPVCPPSPSPAPSSKRGTVRHPYENPKSILDAFPAPPTATRRPYRASSPFPFALPPRAARPCTPPPLKKEEQDWLDLETSPSATSGEATTDESFYSAYEVF
ncbi:hypothetical protein FB45DRAFT_874847 [Roridomyces roridus]|uniref:Uncharacterized protein n=1 Tax=Roridomyces roridus TaxID=1738132 RepID=A0AAD7B727_9AGAR|nr:hypothetical protein FB45DRAFT_874847 [Roridomyces roridus]